MKSKYNDYLVEFISNKVIDDIVDKELSKNSLKTDDDNVIYIKDSIEFIDNILFDGYKAGFLSNESDEPLTEDDFLKKASNDLAVIFDMSIELNDIDDKGLNFAIKKDNLKKALVEAFKVGKASSIVKNTEPEKIEDGGFNENFIGESIVLLSPMLSNPRTELKAGDKGIIIGVGGTPNDQKLYVEWQDGIRESIIVNLDDFAIFESKRLVRTREQETTPIQKKKWF